MQELDRRQRSVPYSAATENRLRPMSRGVLSVREMDLTEVDVRINYFHDASDDHLRTLGVDRALLPERSEWRAIHEVDYARPLDEREVFLTLWEWDRKPVGFSSLDHIAFGSEAFMHLHMLNSA